MFTIVVLFILFMVFELALNYKKHLTYAFSFYFTGITVLFFASIIYMMKFAGVHFITGLDHRIYNVVSKIPFGISDASRLINIGVVLFMFGSIYIFNITGNKKRLWTNVCLMLPIISFLLLYDPLITYRMFLLSHSENQLIAKTVSVIVEQANFWTVVMVFFYMLLPLLCIYKYYNTPKIHALFVNALLLGLCVILINIYVCWCFVFGFLSPFMPWNVDLNKFSIEPFNKDYRSFLLPLTLLFAMTISYITIWCKPLGSVKLFNTISQNRLLRDINHNIRMIFHANKNAFLAIERLSKQAKEYIDNDSDTAISIIDDIYEISSSGLNTLSHSIDMMNSITRTDTPINLCTCIHDAVEKTAFPKDVDVDVFFKHEPVIINASYLHILECLVNILHNAKDAIEEANRTKGRVSIVLEQLDDYAYLEIRDNGCGISRRDRKNIFSVLYSTKKSSTKWGIGLSYVQKVISAYDGFIHVESEVGKYSCFQIALPLGTIGSI